MHYKDYYRILGVPRDAKPEDIRKAYRLLARKYHPDVSKEPDAEDRFKEINEANEVLRDPERRRAYDALGEHRPGESFRPPPGWSAGDGFSGEAGQFDFSEFFADLFGGQAPGGRGGDVEAAVEISLEEAASGTSRGVQLDVAGGRFTVRIPPGTSDGQRMRVPGRGQQGGDLYLTIRIRPHPRFRLAGHDLYLEVPLAPWEAALGVTLEVPTLSSRAKLKVPHGVRAGQKLRLTGQGLPRPGGGSGDLFAVIQIVTPGDLSPRERELFEELARVSDFKPRHNF